MTESLKPDRPCVSAGWIAPNGDFYKCRGWEHDRLARRIADKFGIASAANPDMVEAGWIRFYFNGTMCSKQGTAWLKECGTQSQLNTLSDLLEKYKEAVDRKEAMPPGEERWGTIADAAERIQEAISDFEVSLI